MRTWIKSACVVLAWSILPVTLVAIGMQGSVQPAQANTRTASSTEVILTSTLSAAAAPVTAASHNTKYVVQGGNTLSGIAARFAVRGGWPALYAANRRIIGPDPNVIHAGTVLGLPHAAAPSPPVPRRVHRRQRPPTPRPSPRPSPKVHPLPSTKRAPAATGMPRWLKTMLLAMGLLILVAFLAEPVLVGRRRRRRVPAPALQLRKVEADQGLAPQL